MIRAELIKMIDTQNTLGEGVLWRQSDQTLWWTDIQEKMLFRLSWPGEQIDCFSLPERLGSFGFVENDDDKLICAFESGFALFEPDRAAIQWLACPESLGIGCRLNDERVAPDGSFWAGSMIEDRSKIDTISGLYRLEKGQADLMITGLRISNGIAWSSDKEQMFFADSHKGSIFKSRYPLMASISPSEAAQHTIFARLESGAPDGAVTDSMGRYWSAIWGQACVRCFLPDSSLAYQLSVPALQPTCVAFGGQEGDLLFVSSAREGLCATKLERYPDSGNIFVYKTNACGSVNYRYML